MQGLLKKFLSNNKLSGEDNLVSAEVHQPENDRANGRPIPLAVIVVVSAVFVLLFGVAIAIAVMYFRTANDPSAVATPTRVQSHSPWQTCLNCYSVREDQSGSWTVTYKSSRFDSCSHNWDDGLPFGVEEAIRDGFIVLVYQEDHFGAFIPTAQTANSMNYTWYYRQDGKGTLDPMDSAVQTGTGQINVPAGQSGGSVTFGPFSMFWSEYDQGKGWIYYNAFAGGPAEPDDVRICLTDETDITKIDASVAKWIYRAFPGDDGLVTERSSTNAR